MQSISDAITSLLCSIVSLLAAPTIFLLLVKTFMPALGNPLWHGYCQLLGWLFMAPVRLIRLLVRAAAGRRHP